MIIAGASTRETKMSAAVLENGDFFCNCGSNNWETVEDRWVHTARGLASTELSFHSSNVLRIVTKLPTEPWRQEERSE